MLPLDLSDLHTNLYPLAPFFIYFGYQPINISLLGDIYKQSLLYLRLSNGGGNTKSSSVGILISGSRVSNSFVTPTSIPSIGGGWKIFLFCSSNIFLFYSIFLINSLLLSISSPFTPNGEEESILLGIKGCIPANSISLYLFLNKLWLKLSYHYCFCPKCF